MGRQHLVNLILSATLLVFSIFAQPGLAQSASDDVTYATSYGVAPQASPAENQAALQAAMNDIAQGKKPATLLLPRGEIKLAGNVILPGLVGEQARSQLQVIIRGQGSGKNGSWLHFSSGSMYVNAANHLLEDFRITSDNSDALVIERAESTGAPSRSAIRNIRAENSAGSGIVISGSWIHLLENVFARYNRRWGIEGRPDPKFNISANGLTIIGGELQGNGSIEGAPTQSGGSKAGSGGGLLTGPLTQISIIGTTIEGNIGDGLFISERATGVGLTNVYFEKNGSHPDNRDIGNAPPSRPGMGPGSVIISGSNFTANTLNGQAQRHAIELWNVRGLVIRNPVFFGSPAAAYSAEPIAVRETAGGIASGWVELPEYRWSGYSRDFVLNDTLRYGFARKAYFHANSALGPDPFEARVALSSMAGRRVDLVSLYSGQGAVETETRFRRGLSGRISAIRKNTVAPNTEQYQVRLDHQTNLPEDSLDFVQVDIASPVRSPNVRLMSVEITTYEPVLGK